MRVGVVSDPHGCFVGLKAAVDWLRAAGVDLIVCAGDVANFGPQPNACISLLAEQDILCVQGNCDRDMLLPSPVEDAAPSRRTVELNEIGEWGRQQLTPAGRTWLAALPSSLAPAPGLLIVHGGLTTPDEIVEADAIPPWPEGVTSVAAGHLHRPFITRTKRGLWVNAGSAGRPCDGDPRAAVAVLEQEGLGWRASIHRVAFDIEAAVAAIRKARMPYTARMIETQRDACWW